MTEDKREPERFVLVYSEDTATKNKLGCMVGFEVAEIKKSRRGREYDDVVSWKVPVEELTKRGITSVMNEAGAARKRQEKHEYKMMLKNDRY